MSLEQRMRTRSLGQRQSGIEDKTRSLSRELGGKEDVVPGAAQAKAELEQIANEMRQTGDDLGQGAAHEGAGRAGEIAEQLARLRQSMGQSGATAANQSRAGTHSQCRGFARPTRMAPGAHGSHARTGAREIPR